VASVRRIADHPATRVALLILAAAQAMAGAFVLGLAVNIGTSGVSVGGRHGPPSVLTEAPVPAGPFPLATSGPLPGAEGLSGAMAAGPDGSVWFSEAGSGGAGAISRIDRAGRVSRFPVPIRSGPSSLAPAADGVVWFTDQGGSAIGRLAPSGSTSMYPIGSSGYPTRIATAADGNVWFTVQERVTDWIGRMTPAGTVTRYPLADGRRVRTGSILVGPDGNLWFAMSDGLGRMTPEGVLTEVAMTATLGAPAITVGPDRAIWFASNSLTQAVPTVGRVATGPVPLITAVYPLPGGAGLGGIAAGADGNLWVAEHELHSIARVTPGGQVTQYSLVSDRFPDLLAASDGIMWLSAGGLVRFDLPR
jgi:virginiamycin B lyase